MHSKGEGFGFLCTQAVTNLSLDGKQYFSPKFK